MLEIKKKLNIWLHSPFVYVPTYLQGTHRTPGMLFVIAYPVARAARTTDYREAPKSGDVPSNANRGLHGVQIFLFNLNFPKNAGNFDDDGGVINPV